MYAITYNPALSPNNLSAVFTPSGGGAAQPAVTGSIAANGVNSSILGLTLTGKAAPVAGTEYIKYQLTTGGVLQAVNTYVGGMLATGAMFDAESTTATDQSKRIDDQVTRKNAQLAMRQSSLQSQFTRMEVALQKLQGQSSSLLAKLSSTP
jgi:flagellar capping protein FliD